MIELAQPTTAPSDARHAADLIDTDIARSTSYRAGVPHDAFDALRTAGGVAWHHEPPVSQAMGPDALLNFVDSVGFWSVTTHAEVTTVLRDQSLFSSRAGGTQLPSLAPESLGMLRQMMLNMDHPDHTRLRRILQPVFTPRATERLHESIDVNAREIAEEMSAGPEVCELVTAASAEMPLRVLADLLGMPREDRHLIYEWSNALLGFEDPDTGGDAEGTAVAMAALMAYGQAIADDRRATPREDIVSRIVHAEVDGERLSDEEFSMFWLLLIVAGNETTRNALSGAVAALDRHDRWTWLAEHPDHLPTAIDELLRFVSPVMQFRRTATADTILGDQAIRAGDKVVVWYGAANRDPAVFPDPHALDLRRDPNPHLAFGVGPHFCLGAHLARLEMSAMLAELLRRWPRLSVEGPVVRTPSTFINGIGSLPVRLA